MVRAVIFLDFDGVMNTERFQRQLAAEGRAGADEWGPLFDPQASAALRRIVEATDARIVISSSWRFNFRVGSLRMMWEVRCMPGEIDGVLPCDIACISRGEEIDQWLAAHGPAPYVIIDDLDDFTAGQHVRLVEVNPSTGLTPADAQKALSLLR